MRGEDVGDDVRDVAAGAKPTNVAVAEVEWGGAPEVASPHGQGLRLGAVIGGEEGDDGAADIVREVADEVGAAGQAFRLLFMAPDASAALRRHPRFLGPGSTNRRH